MAHPHNDLRDHKVSDRRLSMFGGMPKRASGGSVEHSDERADKAIVKSMVKGASLKAAGGKVKARADRACRRKGGKVMKRRDDGGAVDSSPPPQRETVTTDNGATVGSGMRPNPNARYDPRTGKVKGFARGGKVKKGKGTNVNVIIAPQGGGMPPGPPPGMAVKPPMMPPPGPGGPPPGAPPMMPHKTGGRAYQAGGRVKRADGGPVGDKGPRRLPLINDSASLQRALRNAEGDEDIARIKAHMDKRGYDTTNYKAGGRVKRAWGGAMPGLAMGHQMPPTATMGAAGGNMAPPGAGVGMGAPAPMMSNVAGAGGMQGPGGMMFAKGGAVKSGNTWKEGIKDGTQVQHNDSGKTADQKDGVPSRKGMRVVTFWAGGAVKRKTGGPVFSNGKAGAHMAPKLPSGSGGGEGRLAKRKLAYGHPAKEVNGAR